MIKKLKLPIIKRNELSEKTIEIRFGLNKKFNFKPGQYISIIISEKTNDNKGSKRDFSISSSPNNKNYISTCFRIPDTCSDFKKFITSCKLKTEVEIQGPQGIFTLPKSTKKEIVLIAGGVGITPFMSMLRYISEENLPYKITLIFTDKSESRAPYLKEIKKLKNINLIFRNKRINSKFLEETIKNKKSLFYICGSPNMVSNTRDLVLNLGVDESNINIEEFSGY